MIPDILSNLLIFGAVVSLSFVVDFKRSLKYWYMLLLFFTIGIIDSLFHTLTINFREIQLIRPHVWNNNLVFNWSAKLYSIVFALVLLVPLKNIITPDKVGLRLKQNKNSVQFSLLFILIFFVVAFVLGNLSGKAPMDTNTLCYTAIMPGLAEELMYRGVLLALLNEVFDRNFKVWGTNFGWGAILTSVVFGLLHGVGLSNDYQLHFDLLTVMLTGFYGFIYVLIRERSGSLVFPVIGHSIADFFNFFFRMV